MVRSFLICLSLYRALALIRSILHRQNHRIQFTSSVNQTKQHIADTLAPVAKKFNMHLAAFDDQVNLGSTYIKLQVLGVPLEPAPRSLTSGGVWDLFSGSIKHAFPTKDGSERVVTPFSSTGSESILTLHSTPCAPL